MWRRLACFVRSLGTASGLLLCMACGDYSADLQTMCDGPSLKEQEEPGFLSGSRDESVKARLIAMLVVERLRTREGRAFFDGLGSQALDLRNKAKRLREESAKQGVSKCAFADWWESQAP